MVHVGWPAAVASFVHGVAPRLTLRLTALADRLLPAPGGAPGESRRGREIPSSLRGSPVLRLGDRAAAANNESPGHARPH